MYLLTTKSFLCISETIWSSFIFNNERFILSALIFVQQRNIHNIKSFYLATGKPLKCQKYCWIIFKQQYSFKKKLVRFKKDKDVLQTKVVNLF